MATPWQRQRRLGHRPVADERRALNPTVRTASVGAGCTQGDVDHATHAFGLAVPAGIISTTGIAGLTLSGGHGYLSRKYGLTIDNLIEADVVLADGSFVTTNEDSIAVSSFILSGAPINQSLS